MRRINVAVIGTGWIGSMRASGCVASHLVDTLYLAELDKSKGERVAEATGAVLTTDYHELLERGDIEAVFVSTTPEATHYPIARDCLLAGKHVLMEKPMGLSLADADDLVTIARRSGLTLTVGYTTRFNPRYAFIKQCLEDGTLGLPVTASIQHSDSRSLGHLIAGRSHLGPAQMIATHDIDFMLWWMEPARPVQVFGQTFSKLFRDSHGVPDGIWIIVTMDDGTAFTIGASWVLPPSTAHFASNIVEFIGTEGAIQLDDSRSDVIVRTMKDGMYFPLATRPGEPVLHTFQGPMQAETIHFVKCVAEGTQPLVTLEQARRVMEVTMAADLSAERGVPVSLPLAV